MITRLFYCYAGAALISILFVACSAGTQDAMNATDRQAINDARRVGHENSVALTFLCAPSNVVVNQNNIQDVIARYFCGVATGAAKGAKSRAILSDGQTVAKLKYDDTVSHLVINLNTGTGQTILQTYTTDNQPNLVLPDTYTKAVYEERQLNPEAFNRNVLNLGVIYVSKTFSEIGVTGLRDVYLADTTPINVYVDGVIDSRGAPGARPYSATVSGVDVVGPLEGTDSYLRSASLWAQNLPENATDLSLLGPIDKDDFGGPLWGPQARQGGGTDMRLYGIASYLYQHYVLVVMAAKDATLEAEMRSLYRASKNNSEAVFDQQLDRLAEWEKNYPNLFQETINVGLERGIASAAKLYATAAFYTRVDANAVATDGSSIYEWVSKYFQ